MTHDQIILGLSLLVREASDFLKIHKRNVPYYMIKQFHGAKRNLINHLATRYTVLECRRMLQIHPSQTIHQPICLLKYKFLVGNQVIDFHTPLDKYTPYTSIKLTTRKVLIFKGKVQPKETSIEDSDTVIAITNRLNSMAPLIYGGDHILAHDTIWTRLEECVNKYGSPSIKEKINAI